MNPVIRRRSLEIYLLMSVLVSALVSGFVATSSAQPAWPDEFDHFRTGFPLTGHHEVLRCESCHAGGGFVGTPRACAVCHAPGGSIATTSKPPTHIVSGSNCEDCHTTASWHSDRFDHRSVTASCITCHNGQTATGKTPNHLPSSSDCSSCHNEISWGGALFDHAGIVGNCASCHNGSTAIGKPTNHPPTSNRCEDCHDTASWGGARFDHSGITGNCVSCHNGTTAPGKPTDHLVTNSDCVLCHTTLAWTSATFDHSGITGNCSSCHNGTTATGKPPQHFVTSLDCDTCHRPVRWTPDQFDHTSPNYPGDHAGDLACTMCHSGNSAIATWSSPAFLPDCAGCHAGDYKQDSHKKVDSPTIRYTVSELRDCTGACHQYTDPSFTTIENMRNGRHRVTSGDW